MNMQQIARGWFVYTMTSSALDLAWVVLSFMAPQACFSLWGGVVADRFRKRRVLMAAQFANCAATLAMATVILSGRATFWDFIWFGAFNGAVLAFSMPARHAFVPELVPRRLILTAMALNTAGMNFARILGPALAGFLIARIAGGDTTSALGVGIVYCAIAALYFIAAATVSFVSQPGTPPAREVTSPVADLIEGLRYVRGNPPVLGLILLSIVPFLFGMPVNTLLPAFNEDVLGGTAEDLGLLLSGMGFGAIAGSLMLAAAGDLRRKGIWLIAASMGWAAATGALGFASTMAFTVMAVAAFGWLSSWTMALNRGLLQTHADMRMRGRVMSIDMMSHGLMPLGAIPVGMIADHFGVATALMTSGVLFLVCVGALAASAPAVRRIQSGFATA